jgi:phage terminase Nu1 subunit (DNA packaging protein)
MQNVLGPPYRGAPCGGIEPASFDLSDPHKTTFRKFQMNIEPTTTVDDATLAALIGVSARRIRQLVEAGELSRAGRNAFQLGPALRELLVHAAGDGASGALITQRTRATKAAADLREIDVAKARGEVARVEDFRRVQGHTAMLVRTNMLNIPSRAVLRLIGETDETRFKHALREEIVLALRAAYDAIKSRNIEEAVNHELEAREDAQ